jgi:fructoselysine transporter
MTFGTVFVHRKKPQYNPLWKMPAWRLMAILAMFTTGTLIVSTFLLAPLQGLIAAVVIIVTGLPVYYYWEKKSQNPKIAA